MSLKGKKRELPGLESEEEIYRDLLKHYAFLAVLGVYADKDLHSVTTISRETLKSELEVFDKILNKVRDSMYIGDLIPKRPCTCGWFHRLFATLPIHKEDCPR